VTTTKIVLCVLGMGALAAILIVRAANDATARARLASVQAEGDATLSDMRAEIDAKERDQKRQLAYLDSEAEGDLYVKCIGEPPKQASNQKRCEAVVTRVEKKYAALKAEVAKDRANW
jgi:hypothetical protein